MENNHKIEAHRSIFSLPLNVFLLCFCSALRLSTRLRYRSLRSLLMLALCKQSKRLTVLFPVVSRLCRKREQLKAKLPTAFSSSRYYHRKTLHYKTPVGSLRGDCVSPHPSTSPKNSCGFALRVWYPR